MTNQFLMMNWMKQAYNPRIQELEELMHALSSKLYEAAAAEVSEEEGDETEDSDVVEADFEVLDSDEDDNDE